MLRLRRKDDQRICRLDTIKDSEMCAILLWKERPYLEGSIAQRFDKDLIILGSPEGQSFPDIFQGEAMETPVYVSRLKPGETLIVQEVPNVEH